MSIEAIGGEETEAIALFDGEMGYREILNETIVGIARRIIELNCFLKEGFQSVFLPLHSGEYGQTHSTFQEVACRTARFALCFPSWMVTLPMATAAAIVVAVGNYLHNCPYRIISGSFNGDVSKKPKLLLLNPRMLSGTDSLKQAGIIPGRDRLERIVDTIKNNNPDVVFLSEVSRFMAPALAESLKENYHFFFMGMGEKMLGEDTSFFIAFRGELIKPPEYIPFRNQDWQMERGYFVMETKERIYVCTYNPTADDLEEICERDFGDKQVVFMGEMDTRLQEILIDKGFVSAIPNEAETTTSSTYQHFHNLEESETNGEPFLFMSQMEGKTDVVPLHDDEKIDEALSDHSLILHR